MRMPSADIKSIYNFRSVRSHKRPQLEAHHVCDHTRTDPEYCYRVHGAKHLFAASEIGLFEALADGPASLEELAGKTAVPARTVGIVAAAMVSLGLIDQEGSRYRNGEAAASSTASAICSGKGSPTLYAAVRVRRSSVISIASSSKYFQPVLKRSRLR
jgi:hypothetical protein